MIGCYNFVVHGACDYPLDLVTKLPHISFHMVGGIESAAAAHRRRGDARVAVAAKPRCQPAGWSLVRWASQFFPPV